MKLVKGGNEARVKPKMSRKNLGVQSTSQISFQFPESYNWQEYYQENGFNPELEVKKEKNLDIFFKKKFEKLGECLEENKLKNFLIERHENREAYALKKQQFEENLKLANPPSQELKVKAL